jgi:hypothetical protein
MRPKLIVSSSTSVPLARFAFDDRSRPLRSAMDRFRASAHLRVGDGVPDPSAPSQDIPCGHCDHLGQSRGGVEVRASTRSCCGGAASMLGAGIAEQSKGTG